MKNKGIIAGAIASIGATVATYLGLAEVQKEGLKQEAMLNYIQEINPNPNYTAQEKFDSLLESVANGGSSWAKEILDDVYQAGAEGVNAAYTAAPTLVGTCAVAAACIGALLYYRHRQKAKEAVAQNAESLDM